jgi:tetratricopeptide (TPR) repeat protein
MTRRIFWACVLSLCMCLAPTLSAKEADSSELSLLSFSLTPLMTIPLGADSALFNVGPGVELAFTYRLAFLPVVFIGGSFDVMWPSLHSVYFQTNGVIFGNSGIELGMQFNILKSLALQVYCGGGYSGFGLENGSHRPQGSPMFAETLFVAGGTRVSWSFIPSLSAGLGASYRYFWGLANELEISLGMAYHLPAGTKRAELVSTNQKLESSAQGEANPTTSLLSFSMASGSVWPFSFPGAGPMQFNIGNTGPVIDFSAQFRMPFFPALFLGADARGLYVLAQKPLLLPDGSSMLNHVFAGGGISMGAWVDIGSALSVRAFLSGGYAFPFPDSSASFVPYLALHSDLSYRILPSFSVGIGAACGFYAESNWFGFLPLTLVVMYSIPSKVAPANQPRPQNLPTQNTPELPQLLENVPAKERQTAVSQSQPPSSERQQAPVEPAPAAKPEQPQVAQVQQSAAAEVEQPESAQEQSQAAVPAPAQVVKETQAQAQQTQPVKQAPPSTIALVTQPTIAEEPPAPAEPPKPLEEKGKGLVIHDLAFDSVFPIFHTYYDNHRVGRLTLKNTEDVPVTDITVSLKIPQYMDLPKECAVIPEVKAGQGKDVDLYALFKSEILGITEKTKVAAEVSIAYTLRGRVTTLSKSETIRVFDRNAMTWDDNRKAAAFVTAKDPSVLMFSNNVNAMVKSRMNRAADRNLQMALAMHDALRLYGISYVSNPLTSYADVSKDKTAVDTLKFPRETFAYHSGDCSDLSILYCALLESLQIRTAFITIPGHIFIAFALKGSPEDARSSFSHPDELIITADTVWVPLEVTERNKTFLDAWQEGAKEYRENHSKNQADIYPIREAWGTFEAVGLPGTVDPPKLPDSKQVLQDFQSDVTRWVKQEIFAKVAELQANITKSKESAKAVNALGVLYARYDLEDEAEAQFQKAANKEEYAQALVNLGNLYFLKQEMEKALSFYERALKKAPRDPKAMLGVARASHELENYFRVKQAYDQLKKVAPDIAQQFAYLELKGDEATRAAELSGAKETVIWAE